MSTNLIQQSPYLRTSRNFPFEQQPLIIELTRSYIDIASKINDRTIGIYPTTKGAITGDAWYVTKDQKQQTFRQVYPFTATGNIAHGLTTANLSTFTPNCYGSFTDGTNWYGAIFASNTAIAGQVSFYVTSTNIVVLGGAGAPTITSGLIVLEWLSLT